MSNIIHIICDECEGRSIVKIPSDMQDDYVVAACPYCGAPVDPNMDLENED